MHVKAYLTRYRCDAPKIETFFYSSKDRLKTKMQIALCTKRRVIFLKNQIVFLKSFKCWIFQNTGFSKLRMQNWLNEKVNNRNFGSFFSVLQQIKKERLLGTFTDKTDPQQGKWKN